MLGLENTHTITLLYFTSALIVQSHDDRGVSALTINGTTCRSTQPYVLDSKGMQRVNFDFLGWLLLKNINHEVKSPIQWLGHTVRLYFIRWETMWI